MFRFAHPEHLYALGILPLLLLLFLYVRAWKRKAGKKFAEPELLTRLTPGRSKSRPVLKFIMTLTAFALIIIAWANPQIGTKLEEVKREGVDIIIALDVSNSMLAEDIRPNRLERAKQSISRLISKLQNDRIGLIVFAGQSYVQLPVTTDYAAARLFLSTIETNMVPTQGTCIGCAIDMAMESFVSKDNKHKALIIITDGENHEDDAVEKAKVAAQQGVVIHTIGMGSTDGAPIPVVRNGTKTGYLKDKEGNTVITRLEAMTLEQIAAEGKGRFIRATNTDDGLSTVMTQIGKMEKKEFGTKQFTDYEDRFQYFLAAGLILLLLEFLLTERRSRLSQRINLFNE